MKWFKCADDFRIREMLSDREEDLADKTTEIYRRRGFNGLGRGAVAGESCQVKDSTLFFTMR
jgi:hypothetical protein